MYLNRVAGDTSIDLRPRLLDPEQPQAFVELFRSDSHTLGLKQKTGAKRPSSRSSRLKTRD